MPDIQKQIERFTCPITNMIICQAVACTFYVGGEHKEIFVEKEALGGKDEIIIENEFSETVIISISDQQKTPFFQKYKSEFLKRHPELYYSHVYLPHGLKTKMAGHMKSYDFRGAEKLIHLHPGLVIHTLETSCDQNNPDQKIELTAFHLIAVDSSKSSLSNYLLFATELKHKISALPDIYGKTAFEYVMSQTSSNWEPNIDVDALIIECKKDNKILEQLCDLGLLKFIDINTIVDNGYNLLLIALTHNNISATQKILAHNPDVNHTLSTGINALLLSSKNSDWLLGCQMIAVGKQIWDFIFSRNSLFWTA